MFQTYCTQWGKLEIPFGYELRCFVAAAALGRVCLISRYFGWWEWVQHLVIRMCFYGKSRRENNSERVEGLQIWNAYWRYTRLKETNVCMLKNAWRSPKYIMESPKYSNASEMKLSESAGQQRMTVAWAKVQTFVRRDDQSRYHHLDPLSSLGEWKEMQYHRFALNLRRQILRSVHLLRFQ